MYEPFNNYLLRSPLFSINFFKNLSKDFEVSDKQLKLICSDKITKEALFLASPSLYFEIEKWLNDETKSEKDEERIKYTILKYLSRMSSRSTPFGLFAGTNVGEFSKKTDITLNTVNTYRRRTRLDMHYLVALSQGLGKVKNIRSQILFYPNSSIYKVGNKLRYIEYVYLNRDRKHNLIEVDDSQYLEKILKKSRKGSLISDLVISLIDDDINEDIAQDFILELISSQILVNELEPSVSGDDALEQIITTLKGINGFEDITNNLEYVKSKLLKLDEKLGNSPKDYIELGDVLKKVGVDFDIKYLFQADLKIKSKANFLSENILKKVKKGILFLNKITPKDQNTNISKFYEAFQERYEEREVLLSKALDVEIGLGYKQGLKNNETSPLIDNLILNSSNTSEKFIDIRWTNVHSIMQKELINSIKLRKSVIQLKDEHFKDFQIDWNDLPYTMSSLIQVVEISGVEKIVMSDVSGSSAVNLLGRFCNSDSKLFQYVKRIIDFEENIYKDELLTEIVHMPESRLGNILLRPSFRKFEIPYLAKSNVYNRNQIELNDLTIKISNNEFILKSIKHNKIITPRLSNAHNFTHNSLPIYHFLCDLQSQGLRNVIGFNFTPLVEEYEYLPRVEYDDIIISVASWIIYRESIESIYKELNDEKLLLKSIKNWRRKLKIPQFILLIEGDNELLINLNNISFIKMFLMTVKKKTIFKINEFLFLNDSIVKDYQGNQFNNQIVVSFYNSKYQKKLS